jgi:hypothetical protein
MMWLVYWPGGNILKVGCLRFGNGDEVHRSGLDAGFTSHQRMLYPPLWNRLSSAMGQCWRDKELQSCCWSWSILECGTQLWYRSNIAISWNLGTQAIHHEKHPCLHLALHSCMSITTISTLSMVLIWSWIGGSPKVCSMWHLAPSSPWGCRSSVSHGGLVADDMGFGTWKSRGTPPSPTDQKIVVPPNKMAISGVYTP